MNLTNPIHILSRKTMSPKAQEAHQVAAQLRSAVQRLAGIAHRAQEVEGQESASALVAVAANAGIVLEGLDHFAAGGYAGALEAHALELLPVGREMTQQIDDYIKQFN